ncbi:chemotaxis protein CheB [Ramlibacter algicola]|uniref:protein-glutamate methylesterase n=1 Tax=Ramlibacter algicola TaxID=2795217 RepID=A0A934Q0F6_9BURK|nr:chemotaxis protein CheB [Ramlibacter algicola]
MRTSLPARLRTDIDAVLVGASAGGLDALLQLLAGIDPALRVPLVVVLHLPADHDSLLPDIFGSRMGLLAREARAGAPLHKGMVHIAPPGYHLLVEPDGTFGLSMDSPVHWSRPSIDVLFESAAHALGPRLAGIVLTGANHDGAAGLRAIGAAGGMTVVQDPHDASHATMPQAALAAARPDFVLPLADIRTLLHQLMHP